MRLTITPTAPVDQPAPPQIVRWEVDGSSPLVVNVIRGDDGAVFRVEAQGSFRPYCSNGSTLPVVAATVPVALDDYAQLEAAVRGDLAEQWGFPVDAQLDGVVSAIDPPALTVRARRTVAGRARPALATFDVDPDGSRMVPLLQLWVARGQECGQLPPGVLTVEQ